MPVPTVGREWYEWTDEQVQLLQQLTPAWSVVQCDGTAWPTSVIDWMLWNRGRTGDRSGVVVAHRKLDIELDTLEAAVAYVLTEISNDAS